MARSSDTDTSVPLDPRVIAEAYGHPLRGRVLAALGERPDVTIGEVAGRLDESPRRIRRHVEALLEGGLAEVTGVEDRRGVIQRRYRAGSHTIGVDDSSSVEQRMELAKATVRLLMKDLALAASAGTLGRRVEDFEVRFYGEVDDECVVQLVHLHWRAYEEILRTFEEGRERLRRSGEPGAEVVSALFLFEAPLWGVKEMAPGRPGRGITPLGSGRPNAEGPPGRSPIYPDPQAMVKAYDYPVRRGVLTALAERPDVTIREVAERLGEPPRRVRHHVEALLTAGLASVTSSEKLSGVIQHRYGAGPLVVDDDDTWSREERVRFAKGVVRLLAADLAVAAAAGTLARGFDDFQVRFYGEVDDECLEQLADRHGRAYRDIGTAIEEGRGRARESGRRGTEIVSSLFYFEAPLWGSVVGRGQAA